MKLLYGMLLGTVVLWTAGALPALAQAQTVQKGKIVKFDYTLRVDGKEIDTSIGKKPLEYRVGDGKIIPGLEKRMEGMKVGEEKTIVVPAAEAYGPVDPKAIVEVPKTAFKGEEPKKPGMVVRLTDPQGRSFLGVVQEVKDKTLVLNFNHPLAGKDLTFDVKVLAVHD